MKTTHEKNIFFNVARQGWGKKLWCHYAVSTKVKYDVPNIHWTSVGYVAVGVFAINFRIVGWDMSLNFCKNTMGNFVNNVQTLPDLCFFVSIEQCK